MYSLFCPSYNKGDDACGFRTDDVGNTTKNGLNILSAIYAETKRLGFKCLIPEAIFFDLSLEQPEKSINMLNDLEKNILNFKKYVPEEMKL